MFLYKSERSWEHFSSSCTKEFKDIMDKLELMDLPLVGGK